MREKEWWTTSRKTKPDELIDELLAGCDHPEEIPGKKGLLRELQKKFVERALEAEPKDHLGYAPHERSRNHHF